MSSLDPEVTRAKAIIELAKKDWDSDNVNVIDLPDFCHPAHIENVSEGDDNGAWVKAWVWVSFADTDFDKDTGEQSDG